MTVNEYRKKHKQCRTCKHFKGHWISDTCMAKGLEFPARTRNSMLRGRFCKIYEPKEYKDG